MAVKEFREFFLRNIKVITGLKKDQEVDYPITIKVKGIDKFNRFLKDHFPSEGIFTKLFESLTFKLNLEDTATTTIQGLSKKALDSEVETRTLNLNTDFTKTVVSHQLPEIVTVTDINDTIVSTIQNSTIKVTILKRTLSGFFRRNYLIEAIGTPLSKYLNGDFSIATTTPLIITGGGSNFLRQAIRGGAIYKFEALLFIVPGSGGNKLIIEGTSGATASVILFNTSYIEDSTVNIIFKQRNTTLPQTSVIPSTNIGSIKIEGTLKCLNSGNLDLLYSSNTGGTASVVKQGSYFIIQEIFI